MVLKVSEAGRDSALGIRRTEKLASVLINERNCKMINEKTAEKSDPKKATDFLTFFCS